MKSILPAVIIIIMAIGGLGCRAGGEFQTHFWTNKQHAGTYYLYLDGKNRGVIPYLPQGPDCADSSGKEKTLKTRLHSGRYHLEIRNAGGDLVYEEMTTMWRDGGSVKLGSSTQAGGISSKKLHKNDCLIIELFF